MEKAKGPHGTCPSCGSALNRQVYGYFLPADLAEVDADLWSHLGGCEVDEVAPAFLCADHGHPIGLVWPSMLGDQDGSHQ